MNRPLHNSQFHKNGWWKLFRKTPARPPLPKGTPTDGIQDAEATPEVDPAKAATTLAHGEADAGYPESDS